MKLLVLTDQITPRISYTFERVFKDLLHVDFELTISVEGYRSWQGPRLEYTRGVGCGEGLMLHAHPLLFESGVHQVKHHISHESGELLPFSLPGSRLAFDPFAASFYFLSRYEEVVEHPTDNLGRFPARDSLSHQLGCLDKPVLHPWAERVAHLLSQSYPGFKWNLPPYRFVPTYDIDIAYAYRGRSWLHTSGTLVRDMVLGRHYHLNERWRVIRGQQPDPYDTYDYLEDHITRHGLEPVFFFLVGNRSARDRNLPHHAKAMAHLVKRIGGKWKVGLHPSSLSTEIPGRLRSERERLEKILGLPVQRSRQHFILLHFPATYRLLEKAGIREDFSMGYPDMPGYRAGISIPFPFYDITREVETDLWVHPFVIMDGTLNHYLQLAPMAAMDYLDTLIATARRWGGTFTSLWHNASLSDNQEWSGWKAVHDHLLKNASH